MRYAEITPYVDTHPFWDMYLFHNIDQSFERCHLNSHFAINHFTRYAIMTHVHISTLMKWSTGLLEMRVCTNSVCRTQFLHRNVTIKTMCLILFMLWHTWRRKYFDAHFVVVMKWEIAGNRWQLIIICLWYQ
jgi:hypothetical protein